MLGQRMKDGTAVYKKGAPEFYRPAATKQVPDLQDLPEDPAEAAIQAGLETHGRRRPH